MMYCRWCGMEMKSRDVCEWCKRPQTNQPAPPAPGASPLGAQPLAGPQPLGGVPGLAGPQPLGQTQPMPPGGGTPLAGPLNAPEAVVDVRPSYLAPGAPLNPGVGGGQARMSLAGEVINDPPSVPQTTQAYPPPGGTMIGMAPPPPPPRTRTAGLSDLPLAAAAPMMLQQKAQTGPSMGERWEKFLALALPVMIVSVAVVHFKPYPEPLYITAMADILLLSIIMGAVSAIPSYEEAYMDCGAGLFSAYLLGPALGLVLYQVICLVRQEWNMAVVNLMTLVVAVTVLLNLAVTNDPSVLIGSMGIMNFMGVFGVFLSFFGWVLSSFFRPINEG